MTALTVRTDRRLIRHRHHSERFVLAQITAPPSTQRRERAPVNLAFVIDRSGSMSGQKLALAKQAVREALDRLEELDRFSIVVYDDIVDVVVASTSASAEARRNAIDRLAQVDARGSTALSDGWLRGCEQVAAHVSEASVDRVLLLTDGLANKGITDPDALARHAGELRARGVSTSTFGVGADFDEALLQAMADAGGGHFYFIADANQIRDHIGSEVGETLEVTATEAELEVLAGEGVAVEAISPHAVTSRGTRTIVALGDLVSDQVVDVLLRLRFPLGEIGQETGIIVRVLDRGGAFAAAGIADGRVGWTYADGAANDAQARDVDVDRVVAIQFAARARQEAVRLNKAHDFDGASRVLRRTARRLQDYGYADPEIRELADTLTGQSQQFAASMSAPALKSIHFDSANIARSRDAMGRSRRKA